MKLHQQLLLTLLLPTIALAQWYTDPFDPTFEFGLLGQPVICHDNGGGAYFSAAYDSSQWVYYAGHVRGDGALDYQSEAIPGLLRLTETDFGIDMNSGVTLVPSQPPGTVIAVGQRRDLTDIDTIFQLPAHAGLLIAKLDSDGFTGFGRMVVEDSLDLVFRDLEHFGLNDHGFNQMLSDGQGGLHLLLHSAFNSGVDTVYYNHLTSTGEWTHELPGVNLLGALYPFVDIFTDGSGGALVTEVFTEAAPEFTNQIRMHCYDMNGEPQFDHDGVLLRDNEFGIGAIAYVATPGELLLKGRTNSAGGNYDQTLYKFTAGGEPLWGDEGRPLTVDDQFTIKLIPDGVGGWMYSTRNNENLEHHYFHRDSANNLIAEVEHQTRELRLRPNGTGGGYTLPSGAGTIGAALEFSVWRWDNQLEPYWFIDSTLAYSANIDPFSARFAWTVTPDTAVVGIVSSLFGVSFFRVDHNGTLGEPPSTAEPAALLPASIVLHQNYPNPFNPATTISFSLASYSEVSLQVFDITGRQVATLADKQFSAGTHSLRFDGSNLASGVYFAELHSNRATQTSKMLLLK